MTRYVEGNMQYPTKRLLWIKQKRPYWLELGPGLSLGYRRTKSAGRWVVRFNGKDQIEEENTFAVADDYAAANGETVLDFWQAQAKARTMTPKKTVKDGVVRSKITLRKALEAYKLDLEMREQNPGNASQVTCHCSDKLLDTALEETSEQDFSDLQISLHKKGLKPATITRIGSSLKAACNLVKDKKVRANRDAWSLGYPTIGGSNKAREDVILDDSEIIRLVDLAYSEESHEFGVYFQTHAETGARTKQIRNVLVKYLDLRDRTKPMLLMPASKKGRNKKFRLEALPISLDLAHKLEKMAGEREADDRLLIEPSGQPWGPRDHSRRVDDVVAKAKLKKRKQKITIYALRHSSIVRHLTSKANMADPASVAKYHDTSVKEIEAHYGLHILNHTREEMRKGLLAYGKPRLVA